MNPSEKEGGGVVNLPYPLASVATRAGNCARTCASSCRVKVASALELAMLNTISLTLMQRVRAKIFSTSRSDRAKLYRQRSVLCLQDNGTEHGKLSSGSHTADNLTAAETLENLNLYYRSNRISEPRLKRRTQSKPVAHPHVTNTTLHMYVYLASNRRLYKRHRGEKEGGSRTRKGTITTTIGRLLLGTTLVTCGESRARAAGEST